MKLPTLIRLIFISLALYSIASPLSAQLDTSRIEPGADSSKTSPTIHALTIPDSIVLPVEVRSVPPEYFLKKWGVIIAALIGPLLVGLITVISAWRANRNTKLLEQSRRDREDQIQGDIYCGFFHAIAVELDAHRMVLRDISRSLPPLREQCLETGRFISPNIPFPLPLSHMNFCRTKVLEYKRFNTELLNELSAYINSSAFLNANLDFTPLINIHHSLHPTQELAQVAIRGAFDALVDHLRRIVVFRPELRQHIIDEVRRFPGNVIQEEEDEAEEIELWDGIILII